MTGISNAFAPAHVSGLFAVHDDADPLKRGSRGAGWCLRLGAFARVEAIEGPTEVLLEGRADAAPVTRTALEHLAPAQGFRVELVAEAPVGQGFGMSAAGTLAAALAVCDITDRDPEDALKATHVAEVSHGTGLGDAIGSWFGGGELRMKPGCPPHGWAMRLEPPEDTEFLFSVLGDPIGTANVIREAAWQERTQEHGDAAVDRILDAGRGRAWRQLLLESAVFSQRLGLMPERMAALGAQMPDGVQWGQCMLGSTMWVHAPAGDLDRCEAVLEGEGPLLRSGVDPHGARLVRQTPLEYL